MYVVEVYGFKRKIMTNEDKLYEVDTFIAMCEDFMHGKDGDDATKCRRLLSEVIKDLSKLSQHTVIKNEVAVCEYCGSDELMITTENEKRCGNIKCLRWKTDC